MHFLICTELKIQISQDGDEVINAKLFAMVPAHHLCSTKGLLTEDCIHCTRYFLFLWVHCRCSFCLTPWWEAGWADRLCRRWFSALSGFLLWHSTYYFRIYVSLRRGKGYRKWMKSQKEMKGVMGWWELWSVLCLHPSHLCINAIQMISCKKLYLHRCDGWK